MSKKKGQYPRTDTAQVKMLNKIHKGQPYQYLLIAMLLSVTHIANFGYSEERIGLILCLGNAHFLIHIQTLTPSYIYGLLASSRGDYFLNLHNNDVRLVSGVLLQFESNYLGSCKYPSNTFRRLVICTIIRRYHLLHYVASRQ